MLDPCWRCLYSPFRFAILLYNGYVDTHKSVCICSVEMILYPDRVNGRKMRVYGLVECLLLLDNWLDNLLPI